MDRGTEIFRVNFRRSDIAGKATAFTCIGWIKGDGKKSTFGLCLRLETR